MCGMLDFAEVVFQISANVKFPAIFNYFLKLFFLNYVFLIHSFIYNYEIPDLYKTAAETAARCAEQAKVGEVI